MNEYRIVIPFDVHRTSQNQRLHWRGRRRNNKAAHAAARIAYTNAGCPKSAVPVRLDLIVRRARRLDQGNIWGAMKPIIDAVFCSTIRRKIGGQIVSLPQQAVVPDDTERWLRTGTIKQEIARSWKGREQVELIITETESPVWAT